MKESMTRQLHDCGWCCVYFVSVKPNVAKSSNVRINACLQRIDSFCGCVSSGGHDCGFSPECCNESCEFDSHVVLCGHDEHIRGTMFELHVSVPDQHGSFCRMRYEFVGYKKIPVMCVI